MIPVVQTKGGTVSVASAFAGHQEGNSCIEILESSLSIYHFCGAP